jgi:hypothetical protein
MDLCSAATKAMNIVIDVSLLSADDHAIGRIHGSLSLMCVPTIGSSISFLYPKASVSFPKVEGFGGLVRVSSMQFAANNDHEGVLALLEDIVVRTRQDGLNIARFLQEGFRLFFEEYD